MVLTFLFIIQDCNHVTQDCVEIMRWVFSRIPRNLGVSHFLTWQFFSVACHLTFHQTLKWIHIDYERHKLVFGSQRSMKFFYKYFYIGWVLRHFSIRFTFYIYIYVILRFMRSIYCDLWDKCDFATLFICLVFDKSLLFMIW